jgi:peptidoglycan/LPS O-acetylase OafA/YrhL
MASPSPAVSTSIRLTWLDELKGISILWIVFFHFFGAYADGRYPSPLDAHYFSSFVAQCAPSTAVGTAGCIAHGFFVAVSLVGFHAVAVFLVVSGFGLTYALAKTGNPDGGWGRWYRSRLLRLFPMYWLAHLIYLVSPFVARPEAIDYRFWLSLVGDRVYPIESIFYYANPAWWYFGLLLELYLVFPLLFRLLQRLGPARFLVICGLATVVSRLLLLLVIPVHGYYVQGGFFGARLWEFALGMTLGLLYRRQPSRAEGRVFAGSTLLAGVVIYIAGLYSYATLLSYMLNDALIGTGLFIILAHLARSCETLPRLAITLAQVGAYSYGLYLLHQPYVIYLGERMRDLHEPVFFLLASACVALLTLGSIPVERAVNRLVERVAGRTATRRGSGAGSITG